MQNTKKNHEKKQQQPYFHFYSERALLVFLYLFSPKYTPY